MMRAKKLGRWALGALVVVVFAFVVIADGPDSRDVEWAGLGISHGVLR
jgi:hypothetical protein